MSGQPHSSQHNDKRNPYASPAIPDRDNEQFRTESSRTVIWTTVSGIFGCVIGAGSRFVRPMISGPIHYESIVAGVILVLFCGIVAVRFSTSRLPRFVVFSLVLLTWGTYATGWMVVHGRFWDDLLFAATMGAGVSWLVAMLLIHISRRMRRYE